jgi:hypothetical protein
MKFFLNNSPQQGQSVSWSTVSLAFSSEKQPMPASIGSSNFNVISKSWASAWPNDFIISKKNKI